MAERTSPDPSRVRTQPSDAPDFVGDPPGHPQPPLRDDDPVDPMDPDAVEEEIEQEVREQQDDEEEVEEEDDPR